MRRKYTPEMHEFIVANAPGITTIELAKRFSERFDTDTPAKAIRSYLKSRRIRNGVNCTFKKGHRSPYVCPKGVHLSPDTEFKRGHAPHNYQPVGTLRVNGSGYVDRKIADPDVWKCEHQLVWEEAHGPIPKGMKMIFLDGNKQNTALENLELISAAEMLAMNRERMHTTDPELTRTGVLIAKVMMKTYQLKEKQNAEI